MSHTQMSRCYIHVCMFDVQAEKIYIYMYIQNAIEHIVKATVVFEQYFMPSNNVMKQSCP